MAIKKQFIKTKQFAKLPFQLKLQMLHRSVVGGLNKWDPEEEELSKLKDKNLHIVFLLIHSQC